MESVVNKENLEARLERIRIRNEEIEKKHKRNEEDKLLALKTNAMVETKPPRDEDWPRTHKYDNVDFTYDEEESSCSSSADLGKKREHKKFANGDGPPPDPAYNFLADKDRDGEDNKTAYMDRDKKPKSMDNTTGSFKKSDSFKSYHNNHQNGQNKRGKADNSRRNWGDQNNKGDQNNRQRENWRKDRVEEKPNHLQKQPSFKGTVQKQPQENLVTEKRGNITISVSQDGEIKSVKLASTPSTPGTGRVGPRAITKQQQFAKTSPENRPNPIKKSLPNRQPEGSKFSVQNRLARPLSTDAPTVLQQ